MSSDDQAGLIVPASNHQAARQNILKQFVGRAMQWAMLERVDYRRVIFSSNSAVR